jgi:cytochrome c553
MKPSLVIYALLLAAGCAACASLPAAIGGQDLSAIGRGRAYAERECGHCHAVSPTADSRDPAAPTFASIRLRYTGPSLERELQAIEEVGHYHMPARATLPGDRRDLIAYIESLGG